jgi:hypothetical protein
MSINLAELGHVLCREFDQRENDLQTIHEEMWTKVKHDRQDIVHQRDVDRANLQMARTQIREAACDLLDKCRIERRTMEQGLKADRVSQIKEMKYWVRGRGEELKSWYAAGRYMFRKPQEKSKDGYITEGYEFRKRTGR